MMKCIILREFFPNLVTFEVRISLDAAFLQPLQFQVVLGDFLEQH